MLQIILWNKTKS